MKKHPVFQFAKRLLIGVAVLYAAVLLALAAQAAFWPQRSGLLALAEIFAPFLFAPLLLAVPLALARRAVGLRLALLACALVFVLRFVPWHPAAPQPAPSAGPPLTVMAWNIRVGGQPNQVRAVLQTRPAAIVSLEEAGWQWITADATIKQAYPYQATLRADSVQSIVLLSTYPIRDSGLVPANTGDKPRALWAHVDLGGGREVTVIAAHPPPAALCEGKCAHLDFYDSTARDARIWTLRRFVDPLLAQHTPFLLIGDFNTADREPAYRDLAWQLHDAQAEVGQGAGLTWRPVPLMKWNLALLRIDYLFSSPNVLPLSTSVDCTPRGSDHCRVQGQFAIQ